MPSAQRLRQRFLAALLAALGGAAAAAAPVALPSGEYDLTTDTALPHLEEALRYATTRARQCLQAPEATELFPLLRHQAFTGCTLQPDALEGDGLHFTLQCANAQAASGSAVFEVDANRVTGVLALKMGGKNMTLSQRLHGPRLGACPGNPPQR